MHSTSQYSGGKTKDTLLISQLKGKKQVGKGTISMQINSCKCRKQRSRRQKNVNGDKKKYQG